ncbi:MAG: halocyanin domain-containing protein [Halobaculum sp.]
MDESGCSVDGDDDRRPVGTATRRGLLSAVGVGAVGAVSGCLESTDSGPYGGYLSTANGFESVVDRTGQSSVTVRVGAGEGLAFAPAAVKVSPGTTVVWKWTGLGGRHNVASEEAGFSSPYYVGEGQTFERTFAETGVVKYHCVPHKSAGMLGVVEVVEG